MLVVFTGEAELQCRYGARRERTLRWKYQWSDTANVSALSGLSVMSPIQAANIKVPDSS